MLGRGCSEMRVCLCDACIMQGCCGKREECVTLVGGLVCGYCEKKEGTVL